MENVLSLTLKADHFVPLMDFYCILNMASWLERNIAFCLRLLNVFKYALREKKLLTFVIIYYIDSALATC